MLEVEHRTYRIEHGSILRLMNQQIQYNPSDRIRLGLCVSLDRSQSGLISLLFTVASVMIVGQAAAPAEASLLLLNEAPDILLIDVGDPQSINYSELIELRQNFGQTQLIVLATRHRRGVLDRLYRLGVSAFVTEDVGLSTLVEVLKAVRADPHLFVVRLKS
jgi:DNA-binding NarL/FixJ family response regulator